MNSPRTPRTPRTPSNNLSSDLSSIQNALNPLKIPWAVSGSMAMKLHANKLGINLYRKPNDIDIVARSKDFPVVVYALGTIGYKIRGPPPVRAVSHLKLYKGSKSIDILQSGSELAPNLSKTNINLFNKNVPIIKVKNLLAQKKSNNLPSEITKRNIQFLNSLL